MSADESGDEGWTLDPRLRALIDRQFLVLVGVAVVLVVLGGWLTHGAHVDSGTHTETRSAGSWETQPAFGHQAQVSRENGLFPVGRTLENRSAYIERIAPVLRGRFRYGFQATGEGSLTVAADADLVVRSTTSGGDDEIVLWQDRRDLASQEATLAPGERLSVPFSVNVSAVQNRSTNISERLGTDGETEMAVVVTTLVEGEALGEPVTRNRTFRLAITASDGTYRPSSGANGTRRELTRTVRVPNEPGTLQAAGGPLLVLVGLAGLVGLGVGRYQGRFALTEAERERLAYESERGEFEDWITGGRVPPEALDRPRIEVESLEGLVDVAIDTDERVIEQADGTYYVLADPWLYVYEAPVGGEERVAEPTDAVPLRQRSGSTAADVTVAEVTAPETIVPGEPLSVDAVVTNESETPVTATVLYRVNRRAVADKEVRLAPNERRELSFVLSGGETAAFDETGVAHSVVVREVVSED